MGIGSSIGSLVGSVANRANQQQPVQSTPQPVGGKGVIANAVQQSQPSAPPPPSQAQVIQNAYQGNQPNLSSPPANQISSALPPPVPQPMGGKGGRGRFPSSMASFIENNSPMQTSFNPFNQPQLQVQQNPYAGPTPPGTIGHFGIDQYGRGAGQGFGGPPPNQGGMPSPFNPYAAPAQQPMFDQFTTQAEFDRARGITSTPTPPTQVQPQQPQANPMMDLTGQQAMRQMMQQQRMNRMYGMGGKGGGFGGRFGGFGGFNPYAASFYKDGGKVKK